MTSKAQTNKYKGLMPTSYGFQVRKQVPADVRAFLGKREIVRSLKTDNLGNAKLAYPAVWKQLNHVVAMARHGVRVVGPDEAVDDRSAWLANIQSRELFEQRQLSERGRKSTDRRFGDDYLTQFNMLRRNDTSLLVEFKRTLEAIGVELAEDHTDFKEKFDRYKAIRLRDIMANHQAEVMELAASLNTSDPDAFEKNVYKADTRPKEPAMPTIQEVYDDFKDNNGDLFENPDNAAKYDQAIAVIKSHVGGNVALNSIKISDATSFAFNMRKYPRNRTRVMKKMAMNELIAFCELTQPGYETMTQENISKNYVARLERIWRWGIKHNQDVAPNYKNPWDKTYGVKDDVKGKESTVKIEFQPRDIRNIFGKPMFKGFEGKGHRGYREIEGDHIIFDDRFYLPIICLFHGNRIGEIVDLPLANFGLHNIDDPEFDEPGEGINRFLLERTMTKTKKERSIPLHSFMEKIGFLDYVEWQKTRGAEMLFPQWNRENKTGSEGFVQWYARWTESNGLTDPSGQTTLHSYRHTWITAAREALIEKVWWNPISGHAPVGSVGDVTYGSYPMSARKAMIEKIKFKGFPYEALIQIWENNKGKFA